MSEWKNRALAREIWRARKQAQDAMLSIHMTNGTIQTPEPIPVIGPGGEIGQYTPPGGSPGGGGGSYFGPIPIPTWSVVGRAGYAKVIWPGTTVESMDVPADFDYTAVWVQSTSDDGETGWQLTGLIGARAGAIARIPLEPGTYTMSLSIVAHNGIHGALSPSQTVTVDSAIDNVARDMAGASAGVRKVYLRAPDGEYPVLHEGDILIRPRPGYQLPHQFLTINENGNHNLNGELLVRYINERFPTGVDASYDIDLWVQQDVPRKPIKEAFWTNLRNNGALMRWNGTAWVSVLLADGTQVTIPRGDKWTVIEEFIARRPKINFGLSDPELNVNAPARDRDLWIPQDAAARVFRYQGSGWVPLFWGEDSLAPNSISMSKIQPAAVGFNQLQDGAVGGDKIATRGIDSKRINYGAIKAEHLNNGIIGGEHIQGSAIQWWHIQDGTIRNQNLADASVTLSKLAPDAIHQVGPRVLDGDRIKLHALRGTQHWILPPGEKRGEIMPNSISFEELQKDSVQTIHIANWNVTDVKIGDLNGAKIWSESITLDKIHPNSRLFITDGSIENRHLKDLTITGAKIADGTFSDAKIQDMNGEKLFPGTVSEWKIVPGVIGGPYLNNNGDWIPGALATGRVLGSYQPNPSKNPTLWVEGNIKHGGITWREMGPASVKEENLWDSAVTTSKIANGSVTAAKLAPDAYAGIPDGYIGTAKLADGAVTNSKLAGNAVASWNIITGAVDSRAIADGSIQGVDIAAGAITAGHLAPGAIDLSQLADGALTTAKIANLAVTNEKIANNAVDTRTLLDGSVTWKKLADGAVVEAKIADGNVTESKLANGAVSGLKLALGSVTFQHLAAGVLNNVPDNSISTAKLQDYAVTNIKIANNAVTAEKLAEGSVQGAHIGLNQITGNKISFATITNANMGSNSVSTLNIQDLAVTNGKLADGSITSAKLGTASVNTVSIEDGAVTAAKLAPGVVSQVGIQDGSITGAKLAPNAITSDKIADGAIVEADLADGAVTSAKIANGTIVEADLADGAVTSAKIADGTIVSGDIALSGVATGNIADQAVTTAKIADANVTSAKIGLQEVKTANILDAGVVSSKIANGNILHDHIAAGQVDDLHIVGVNGSKIWANSIAGTSLVNNSIDGTKFLDNSVGTAKIADNAVTTAKIADAAVTTAKLPDGAVVTAKIADGSVTNAKMAANSVSTLQIADGSITQAKLAPGVGGSGNNAPADSVDGTALHPQFIYAQTDRKLTFGASKTAPQKMNIRSTGIERWDARAVGGNVATTSDAESITQMTPVLRSASDAHDVFVATDPSGGVLATFGGKSGSVHGYAGTVGGPGSVRNTNYYQNIALGGTTAWDMQIGNPCVLEVSTNLLGLVNYTMAANTKGFLQKFSWTPQVNSRYDAQGNWRQGELVPPYMCDSANALIEYEGFVGSVTCADPTTEITVSVHAGQLPTDPVIHQIKFKPGVTTKTPIPKLACRVLETPSPPRYIVSLSSSVGDVTWSHDNMTYYKITCTRQRHCSTMNQGGSQADTPRIRALGLKINSFTGPGSDASNARHIIGTWGTFSGGPLRILSTGDWSAYPYASGGEQWYSSDKNTNFTVSAGVSNGPSNPAANTYVSPKLRFRCTNTASGDPAIIRVRATNYPATTYDEFYVTPGGHYEVWLPKTPHTQVGDLTITCTTGGVVLEAIQVIAYWYGN